MLRLLKRFSTIFVFGKRIFFLLTNVPFRMLFSCEVAHARYISSIQVKSYARGSLFAYVETYAIVCGAYAECFFRKALQRAYSKSRFTYNLRNEDGEVNEKTEEKTYIDGIWCLRSLVTLFFRLHFHATTTSTGCSWEIFLNKFSVLNRMSISGEMKGRWIVKIANNRIPVNSTWMTFFSQSRLFNFVPFLAPAPARIIIAAWLQVWSSRKMAKMEIETDDFGCDVSYEAMKCQNTCFSRWTNTCFRQMCASNQMKQSCLIVGGADVCTHTRLL